MIRVCILREACVHARKVLALHSRHLAGTCQPIKELVITKNGAAAGECIIARIVVEIVVREGG